MVSAERPTDADVLKLRAWLAAESGDAGEAEELMSDARTRAGETWTDEDETVLESYRLAATHQGENPQ